jgi:hypothetical protein
MSMNWQDECSRLQAIMGDMVRERCETKKEIKKLKERCLRDIAEERALATADEAAGNQPMKCYHEGRMQVWVSVHEMLVRHFSGSE